ncbi:hypothetical protein ADUPG1_000477 [Aduncisulcus paluster]|uniref:Uncharacterized protein n=1 Tax=Aduncisulcus paluster TaxID=2918883 RepID=A0ABQ5K895_9EUKA|nr:hypothetical protein ADUPG1_000477 [Aduncisulcus paluster]
MTEKVVKLRMRNKDLIDMMERGGPKSKSIGVQKDDSERISHISSLRTQLATARQQVNYYNYQCDLLQEKLEGRAPIPIRDIVFGRHGVAPLSVCGVGSEQKEMCLDAKEDIEMSESVSDQDNDSWMKDGVKGIQGLSTPAKLFQMHEADRLIQRKKEKNDGRRPSLCVGEEQSLQTTVSVKPLPIYSFILDAHDEKVQNTNNTNNKCA